MTLMKDSLSLMVLVSRLKTVWRMVGVFLSMSTTYMPLVSGATSLSTMVLVTMSLSRPLMWSTTLAWFSVLVSARKVSEELNGHLSY